jgi:tetratricopeptide (TPR) repeat protein
MTSSSAVHRSGTMYHIQTPAASESPMPKTPESTPRQRPAWALSLDRISLIWSRITALILPSPDEEQLASLARRHRPPPDPMDFDPSEFGVEDHLQRAREALAAGALGEALHHFGQRIGESPTDGWAWHGRGDSLQLMGEHQGALEAYDRAIELSPQTGLHHGGRANALGGLAREVEAEEAWTEALRLDPGLSWMRSDRL